jgi:hypothetical protein
VVLTTKPNLTSPIELAIAEALSRGFRVERLPKRSKRHAFDKRLLLIEGMRCQVISARRGHSNPLYPHAEYFPLYLPRTDWPDFLIYVSLSESGPVFRIVPRPEMTKDTGWAPGSLERYRDAWELIQTMPQSTEKKFEILSWLLEVVKISAQNAGLKVDFLKTKKHQDGRRWPPVIKRRVLIAGRKCAVHSASRISRDPEKLEYNYVHFRESREDWPEFRLYVVQHLDGLSDVFVIPREHITSTTCASLDHPELVRYKNAWNLLSASPESLKAMSPIQWKEPTTPRLPTKHAMILQEVVNKAESLGLLSEIQGEVVSHKGVQNFLYVSKKRCQVFQATVTTRNGFSFISLNSPRSEWPEFLIFHSTSEARDKPKFYVMPRKALTRATNRSVASKWLKEYEEAWHLLR